MELSLLEIWESMGLLARAVAIGLILMGIASLAVSIERSIVLGRIRRSSRAFASRARVLLEANEFEDLRDLAGGFPKTPLARLTKLGIETFQAGRGEQGLSPVEATRRTLGRKLEELASESRRGMGLLASVGSTAPFIGLFGTVIGIITAFQGIAAAGGGGIGAVSAGIAEALIVTAVGLFVAIAAVLFFNYLSGRFDQLDMSMQHAAGELIDHLEASHGHVA
ncbi:MAG: MotA/TolQ/ExbB proton channel family protein [Nannocystaceae bacterium]|nr:MotA/TolQ/ExbB proton channel family protein [Myxococcales bacterium]